MTLGLLAVPLTASAVGALPANAQPASASAFGTAVVAESGEAPAIAAFVESGYSSDDAELLARRWGLLDPATGRPDTTAAKVDAGEWLATGQPLRRHPKADPKADDGLTGAQLRDVFAAHGYTVEDARVLAERWGVSVQRATTAAGSRLKVIGVLAYVDPERRADQGVDPDRAFLKAGYTPLDAGALAERWGLVEPGTGKADSRAAVLKAGSWLALGRPLATYPLSEPKAAAGRTSTELRLAYLDAGYTTRQASILADEWETSSLDAKARAGRELLTVGVLPFVDATA
jgi:hypothetical protein